MTERIDALCDKWTNRRDLKNFKKEVDKVIEEISRINDESVPLDF